MIIFDTQDPASVEAFFARFAPEIQTIGGVYLQRFIRSSDIGIEDPALYFALPVTELTSVIQGEQSFSVSDGVLVVQQRDLINAQALSASVFASNFSPFAVPASRPVITDPLVVGATEITGTIDQGSLYIELYKNDVFVSRQDLEEVDNSFNITTVALEEGDIYKVRIASRIIGSLLSAFSDDSEVFSKTDAPVVDSPLADGETTVTGTSTEANGTAIDVYVADSIVASGSVTGGTWSIIVPALSTGDTVRAKATATGELESDFSNSVGVVP